MNTTPILQLEFEAELETAAIQQEVEQMEPGLGHAIGQAWQNLPQTTKEWIKVQLRLALQDTLRGRPQDAVRRTIAILLPQLYPTALQMAIETQSAAQLQARIRQLVRSTPIPPAVLERRKGMTREQIRQYERRQRARGRTPGRNRALGRGRWLESEIDSATTALEFELAVPSSTAGDLEIASAELANELAAYESGAEQTEQESVGTISSSDYLKWVQRSLNRLYKIRIPTDGKDSNAYRTALRKFNAEYSGRDYSDVDERTQNDLISVNAAPGSYVAWVIRALNAVGAGPLPVSDAYNSAVVSAIKKFQGRPGLGIKVDGYVGAKTELALIKASALLPPGEGRKAAPNGGHKPSLPKPCDTVSGEFFDAIRSFLQERVPPKPPPGEEPQVLLKLLCSSRSFRHRVRNLNRRYVNLHGKMLDRYCPITWRQEKCAVNRDGILTKGPLRGRTVLSVTSGVGSEFLSTRALDNLYGDRHVLFIDNPPGVSKPAERRGWLIQKIAHEAFHAHRHMNPGSRTPETLRERVSASIDEEIEAREFDKKVVKEIRKTSEGRRLLADYVHPGKAFFLQTGHLLTDRFVVERDPFPGLLNLTYLEHFAMSALMHAAADSEGLTNNDIQSINKAVAKMPAVELKPFWKGQDAVKNNDTYKELRLLAVHMDKEWTQLGLSDPWTGSHERMAQEHACVFRKFVTYTPHPDPAIRRPNCS
jgi:hypothetical protein